MHRLSWYYNPKIILAAVQELERLGYNPDKFLDWYLKSPQTNSSLSFKAFSPLAKFLVIFCYYFWILYVASAFLILALNPLIGSGAVLISPFVAVGVLYGFGYVLWHMHYKAKAQAKKTALKKGKKKPTGRRKKKSLR